VEAVERELPCREAREEQPREPDQHAEHEHEDRDVDEVRQEVDEPRHHRAERRPDLHVQPVRDAARPRVEAERVADREHREHEPDDDACAAAQHRQHLDDLFREHAARRRARRRVVERGRAAPSPALQRRERAGQRQPREPRGRHARDGQHRRAQQPGGGAFGVLAAQCLAHDHGRVGGTLLGRAAERRRVLRRHRQHELVAGVHVERPGLTLRADRVERRVGQLRRARQPSLDRACALRRAQRADRLADLEQRFAAEAHRRSGRRRRDAGFARRRPRAWPGGVADRCRRR
jgi:hypothetical protein